MKMLAKLAMLATVALACSAIIASAQSRKITTFCEIDLEQNNMLQFITENQRPPGGSVFASDATKNCTHCATRQTINLQCKKRLAGWTGGRRVFSNAVCKLVGAQCGVDGIFTAPDVVASVAVERDGTAVLTCNLTRSVPPSRG
jgi:hypothetical protein